MNLAPILTSPPVYQFHLAAAVLALGLGTVLLAMRKGSDAHRFLGWVWIAIMSAVAFSSFAITALTPGHFSPVHALSILTLVACRPASCCGGGARSAPMPSQWSRLISASSSQAFSRSCRDGC